ncbi:carbamoyltransferase HypF [Fangia hongkongensis]|uniref:carbamoyltransferase HypF n=1 Tax=Fangia hongkongensis TaxID=270495 RepID=UPI000380B725|nr:carbamoyltransferase HypF [Fangia hongkongensis]MBK2125201.1 carbamoyltransferase HypF [Fangia hongkongensis]
MQRLSIRVNGIVQGVGFRPFVYMLAQQHHLSGRVQNTPDGVDIIVSGMNTDTFINDVKTKLPPLAKIEKMDIYALDSRAQIEEGFFIVETKSGSSSTKIPADVAICEACLDELFDPSSRYHLYPFISCTHCGPRYSIVENLPYDREQTTLSVFPLCEKCKADYKDPSNRRYHAESTACNACGPSISKDLPLVVKQIREGSTVALKGNGGFRFVLDAKNAAAILQLRSNKRRPDKPFALMVLNAKSAKQYVSMTDKEHEILTSRARPIVLMDKKKNHLPDAIAPSLNQLGIMLPQTPLDYLLFYYLLGKPQAKEWLDEENEVVLIVTSANLSGESIIAKNEKALKSLHSICDDIVTDTREIAMKSDDSVVMCLDNKMHFIRRSKAYAPNTIPLSESLSSVVALGAELKNTLCFIKGSEAYVSQYIGDMQSSANVDYFCEVFSHYQKLFGVKYEAVACDLHPDFFTTEFAENLNLPLYRVQHHQAHAFSVIAEHNVQGKTLAVILDGYGYDSDEIARGGELFICDTQSLNMQRIGEFLPMIYASGDKVQKEPWRMAISVCETFDMPVPAHLKAFKQADDYQKLLKVGTLNNLTTSAGRVFDGVSSLLDICHQNTYEAQAAMLLQAKASNYNDKVDGVKINSKNQLDCKALVERVCQLGKDNSHKASSIFHSGLSQGLVKWIKQSSEKYSVNQVVLNGGCFQNRLLLQLVCDQLKKTKIKVYLPNQLPFNDGGISLGQAWYAAKKYQRGELCV